MNSVAWHFKLHLYVKLQKNPSLYGEHQHFAFQWPSLCHYLCNFRKPARDFTQNSNTWSWHTSTFDADLITIAKSHHGMTMAIFGYCTNYHQQVSSHWLSIDVLKLYALKVISLEWNMGNLTNNTRRNVVHYDHIFATNVQTN